MELEFFKPLVSDIKDMQDLVKDEVETGTILLRTEDEMATTIRSYTGVRVDGKLVGFCALHIHSINLAEIRSLIVSEEVRGQRLGKRLVEHCLVEARKLGLKQILSLTYAQKFFEDLNFVEISKESLPEHKIWADCIRCKHFPVCDEIALLYKL